MKAIKRIITLLLIIMVVLCAVFVSYTGIKNGAVVYASVNDDSIYVPLRSESDAVKAFQVYCKSRDLTIEGSLSDAVTTFTTGAFNSACNELGIDITELQAEIKAEYDASGKPVKFLFNDTGVMAMNRIFAQFLQDNELEVGDEDVNKEVYDGWLFEDDSGNKCFVYYYDNGVLVEGTPYIYGLNDVLALNQQSSLSTSFIYSNTTYDFALYWKNYSTYYMQLNNGNNRLYYQTLKEGSGNTISNYRNIGIPIIYAINGNLMLTQYKYRNAGSDANYVFENGYVFGSNNLSRTNIIIVSNTINNNVYEGDTIINNEGDIINNNPDIPDQPDLPDYPNEPTDNPSDWGAEMPDLNIPWYLQGKEDKFPWNIPFNIMLTLSLLKAEPEAPHFEGTMDFKFTTYDYEIDLSQFDDVAAVLRKMEVIAFLIGLMILTRNLIGW